MYDLIVLMPWIRQESVKVEDCKESDDEYSFELLYESSVSSSAALASPMEEITRRWSGGRLRKFTQKMDYTHGEMVRLTCVVGK
jgi:hypothetical protein